MKIVCFAHRLEIGGTQVNAIDLAAGLRDLHGCDVTLFATPGPMAPVAVAKNLRFVPAPDAYVHPSMARMKSLRELVRRERPDVIHAWDWWQCLDAYYSVHLPWGVPLVVTDMMPSLTRVLPLTLPTTFGTPEIVEMARAAGRRNAHLLLPPVDVRANAPGAIDCTSFRRKFALDDSCINVVTVSRLSAWLKSESLLRSIEAVRIAARDAPIRLVIVGDGEAREKLEQQAAEINASLGRRVVILTGALLDPRPAYAAADVVVGMGSSALRALAFAKPLVVVGEAGFAELFDMATAQRFLHTGMYGVGDGAPDNRRLAAHLSSFANSRQDLASLGLVGRRFVEEHFAVEVVCKQLFDVLGAAAAVGPAPRARLVDAVRTTAVYLRERRFLTPSRDRRPRDGVTEPAGASPQSSAE